MVRYLTIWDNPEIITFMEGFVISRNGSQQPKGGYADYYQIPKLIFQITSKLFSPSPSKVQAQPLESSVA